MGNVGEIPSKKDASLWNQFQKRQAETRSDLNERADEVIELTKEFCDEKPKSLQTPRRRTGRHNWVRQPINGYSAKHSDIARHVVGLKFSNYPQREAFESAAVKYEMKPHSVEQLYYRKPELFDLAEKELMENAITEYHQNLWVSRTALSQAGPRAVETLVDILEDADASASVRSKSAIAILKMLDVDGSNNANPSERIALESLKIVRDVKLQSMGEPDKDSYVIDAEFEDNEDEVGNQHSPE